MLESTTTGVASIPLASGMAGMAADGVAVAVGEGEAEPDGLGSAADVSEAHPPSSSEPARTPAASANGVFLMVVPLVGGVAGGMRGTAGRRTSQLSGIGQSFGMVSSCSWVSATKYCGVPFHCHMSQAPSAPGVNT